MRDGEEEPDPEQTPQQKFEADLASAADGGTITLTGNVSKADVDITTLTNLNLSGYTLTGNVTITSDVTGTLNIGAGTITGNLTVNTPNATVTNNATVDGIVAIEDVASGTWNEKANGNTLTIEDNNGLVLNIVGDVAGITVSENAGGEIKINVDEDAAVESLTINKPITIVTSKPITATIANGVGVTVKANEGDPGTIVTGSESDDPVELNPTEPPVDTEAPVINESESKAELVGNKLVLTVKASDNGELAELEVDHSLGKYSGTPEVNQLPEFTVTTEALTDFKAIIGGQEIVVGSVKFEDNTWTLTFSEEATTLIQSTLTTLSRDKIEFYLVVKDVAGNASGSMYDGSYKTVTFKFE